MAAQVVDRIRFWDNAAFEKPSLTALGLWVSVRVGNRPKNSILAEALEDAGADIEKAAVKLHRAGHNCCLDPGKRHEIVERKANRFVLAKIVTLLRWRPHCPATRRFGDANPLADEI